MSEVLLFKTAPIQETQRAEAGKSLYSACEKNIITEERKVRMRKIGPINGF
jgi:hypothetical protein